MKTKLYFVILLLATALVSAQTNSLTGLLQQGLFEEQANRNLEAAIADYENLAAQFDADRQLAATAVFRLGECYRAQGHTDEAATQYQRIIHEFSDQQTLATLSRQNLTGMGLTGHSTTAVEPSAVESPDAQLWNKLKDLAGLEGNQRDTLINYVKGSVRLVVHDQPIDISFYRLSGHQSLATILEKPEAQKLLLSSSDLSRVKVTRRDPKTGKNRECMFDFSPPPSAGNGNGVFMTSSGSAPLSYQWSLGGNNSSSEANGNELWLRDGDVISVPEKRDGARIVPIRSAWPGKNA